MANPIKKVINVRYRVVFRQVRIGPNASWNFSKLNSYIWTSLKDSVKTKNRDGKPRFTHRHDIILWVPMSYLHQTIFPKVSLMCRLYASHPVFY